MKRQAEEVSVGDDPFSSLLTDLLLQILSFVSTHYARYPELMPFIEHMRFSHVNRQQRHIFEATYTEERMAHLFISLGATRLDTDDEEVFLKRKALYRMASIATLRDSYTTALTMALGKKTRAHLYSWVYHGNHLDKSEYTEIKTEFEHVRNNFLLLSEELKMWLALSIVSLHPYRDEKAIVLGKPVKKSKLKDLYTYRPESVEERPGPYHVTLYSGECINLARLENLCDKVDPSDRSVMIYSMTHSSYHMEENHLPHIVKRLAASRRFQDVVGACFKSLRFTKLVDRSRMEGRCKGKAYKHRIK